MADVPEPLAKRQRLETPNGDNLPVDYATLARAEFPVNLESVPEGFDHLILSKYEIEIKFISGETRRNETAVFALKRGNTPKLRVSLKEAVGGLRERLLQDCVRLERYSPNALKKLHVCTLLSLTINHDSLVLKVSLLWDDSIYARDPIRAEPLEILKRYHLSSQIPDEKPGGATGEELSDHLKDSGRPSDNPTWEPRQFYDSVHVPEKSAENSADLRVELLESQLFPFQRRAVRWLLSREGVQMGPLGEVVEIPSTESQPPLGFTRWKDADGRNFYVNQTLGVMSSDLKHLNTLYGTIRGGILAEEMGLGKTVELIALICLNTRDRKPSGSSQQSNLHESRATLIITPPTILEQWKQEIREHAPGLKVFHYEGLKAANRHKDLVEHLSDQDIVLTTYNIISKEVYYVAEKPQRNLRHQPKYDAPKSALTQISWWRVCLDEAQMIESGVSAASTVARMIPRVNAWAVTGTPLRNGHKDLYGLLLFLRCEPWCQSLRQWNRLIQFDRPLFRLLMGEIAIRHSKELVREDLRLPPQSRHTITIPFSAIEEQYYGQLFHEMYEDCGLDRNGAPTGDDWDPEEPAVVEKMRSWLTRLRQTCLHPEVGGRNRKALGRTGGPLRTVQQVLDVMIDQNETSIQLEQRNLFLSTIRRAQMVANTKNAESSLQILKPTLEETQKVVKECRMQWEVETELQKLEDLDLTNDDEESKKESDADVRLATRRQRLRSALEVHHMCIFFIATGYFQLKSDETLYKPDSEEFLRLQRSEEESYEAAKSVRSELLSEVLRKANRLIEAVSVKTKTNSFTKLPKMAVPLDYSGIESRKVFDKLDDFCQAMNVQAEKFNQFRLKMIEFLRLSLIDEDEGVELQGDEYENSTKHQDEMYAYMEVLRALFADRSDALTGQENLLIRHEMKQLLRSAKEGEGPAPEVMMLLLAEREKHRIPSKLGSLRGIITEIRALIVSLQWQDSARANNEVTIATDILEHARSLLSNQSKSISSLEQEVNQFRDTMNSRLDYYRALQKISDTVAPFQEERVGLPMDQVRYQQMISSEEHQKKRISSMLAKLRYLQHLKTESSSSNTTRLCTICQGDFENGTLTVCGHQFCKECIQLWYAEHRNCPMCKKRLTSADFWDITYKPAELAIQEEAHLSPTPSSPSSDSDRSLNKSIYSNVSTTTLNEIKDIELQGASFGSKVDTITRHLFWLRNHDPGSKAIIFSQYREFLDVLGRAFKQSNIAFTRCDEKSGIERFKADPAIECFLLHAKAHSAGLNLVVANHVFLCEPLINTAIELQAIARVHRIGQQRATTVWMYLIADTVEESIYEISVARRLEHLKGKSRSGTATPAMENAIEAANSMELQVADIARMLTSGKGGGEMVQKHDLWQCLFGRAKKREAVVMDTDAPADGEVGRFLRGEAVERRRDLGLLNPDEMIE